MLPAVPAEDTPSRVAVIQAELDQLGEEQAQEVVGKLEAVGVPVMVCHWALPDHRLCELKFIQLEAFIAHLHNCPSLSFFLSFFPYPLRLMMGRPREEGEETRMRMEGLSETGESPVLAIHPCRPFEVAHG